MLSSYAVVVRDRYATQECETALIDTRWEYNAVLDHSFVDGRLYLKRSSKERDPLLVRLRKIEGQVRGLRQMLDEDRYCLDEVQQANAITAGVREVALLIMAQHLTAGIEFAIESKDASAALADLMAVLRTAMRQ